MAWLTTEGAPSYFDLPSTGWDLYGRTARGYHPAIETVENLHTLAPLLGELDERERRIIDMRFGQELTQAQIGAELGISQMHVSRLLSRMLGKLRSGMLTQE